jgi:hypothetical protein
MSETLRLVRLVTGVKVAVGLSVGDEEVLDASVGDGV